MSILFNLTQLGQTICKKIDSNSVTVSFEVSKNYLRVYIKVRDGELWRNKSVVFSTDFLQDSLLDEYALLEEAVNEINSKLRKVK